MQVTLQMKRKSAEEKLRESRDRLYLIADSVPALIAHVDRQQRYVFCNAAYHEWFGVSVKEVAGTHVGDMHGAKAYQLMQPYIDRVLAGEQVEFEIELEHRGKGPRINTMTLTPQCNDQGQVIGYCLLATDITELREAKALAEKKGKELAGALVRAERSNRDLEQFTSICSHDLKEPLRMIRSYVDLLQKRYDSLFDEKASTYFHFIVQGVERMEMLIEDLLKYSRLEAPDELKKRVDMQSLLNQVLANLGPAICRNKAIITSDPLPEVDGYAIQLIQVLQNLIGNALKFRKKEHPPVIHISAERRKREWKFGVRDNGIGIAPGHDAEIFEIFQRLHPRKEYPGTGIGLSVCMKIIEHHGGRIWYESQLEEGTTFYFTLPVEKK
jgi:PAS domain S-box-containing protein